MNVRTRDRSGSRVARSSGALFFVAGFLIAAAGAAFAFWTVNVLFAPTNYALAQANSLSAPTAPTATAIGSAAITVGWTLPGTQLPGAQYAVTRTSGPGSPATVCTVGSTATSCQDTSLTGGTAYGYSVAAFLNGWQSAAVTASATTPRTSQTINFTSTAPDTATVGGTTYTPTATASSSLSVAFTSATPSVCAVSGSTFSFVAVGTCTVNANQAGNANYLAAPQVQQSFAVSKGTPAIAVSHAPTSPTLGQGVTFTATVTGPTGGATPNGTVAWTLTGQVSSCASTTAISGSGSVATATCTITASKAGTYNAAANVATDTNYNAAGSSSTDTLAVAKETPTIAVTHTPASPTLGQAVTFTATVTGPSGSATPTGTISWNLTGQVTSCASTTAISGSGSVATATCSITASKAGTYNAAANVATDTNYNAAGPSSTDTLAVAKGTPTIAVTHTPASPTGGQGVTFTATVTGPTNAATPAGAITWALTGPVTSCGSTTPLAGSTNVATATCTITASAAGTYNASASGGADSNYNGVGPSVADSFNITNGVLVSFSVTNPGTQKAGTAFSVTVTASDSGGNPAAGWISTTGCVAFSGPASSPNATAPIYPVPASCAVGQSALSFNASGQATASVTIFKASATTTLTVRDAATGSHSGSTSNFAVDSKGVVLAFSPNPPPTLAKNASTTFTLSVPNDQYGNAFTSAGSVAVSVTLTPTSGSGGGNWGLAGGTPTNAASTTTVTITTGPAGNTFTVVTPNSANKTATLSATTSATGFTAPSSDALTT